MSKTSRAAGKGSEKTAKQPAAKERTSARSDLRSARTRNDKPMRSLRIDADKWDFIKAQAATSGERLGDYLYGLAKKDRKGR